MRKAGQFLGSTSSLFAKIGLFLLLNLALGGCAGGDLSPRPAPPAAQITVFAAASLTDAFTALGQAFQAQHPGTEVILNFGGSQQLAQQLVQGAPADLFASAALSQMDLVAASGRIAPDTPRIFAQNRLTLVMPQDNPGAIHTLADLARPGLRLVLADESVPVGAYSRAFLAQADASGDLPPNFGAQVMANIVSFEINVRAVLSKVRLGEADAGIVYTSDVTGAAPMDVAVLPIPDHLNVIARYPIAPLTDPVHPAQGEAFMAFVLSPPGQAILAEHGLQPGADQTP